MADLTVKDVILATIPAEDRARALPIMRLLSMLAGDAQHTHQALQEVIADIEAEEKADAKS